MEHEVKLVERYNIKRTVLVEGNPIQEKERAVKMAGALAIVVSLITLAFSTPADAVALGLVTFVGGSFVIYYRIRETIRVEDFLDGRHFACRSIITLLEKKQQISEMAEKFTQFLEALKNWGGREVIEMAPDGPPHRQIGETPCS